MILEILGERLYKNYDSSFSTIERYLIETTYNLSIGNSGMGNLMYGSPVDNSVNWAIYQRGLGINSLPD